MYVPGIGDHLRKNRLHALPLRTGAGSDVNLARGLDADECAFERTDAGAFDVAAEPEAEQTAVVTRNALAFAKRRQAADPLQCFFQRRRVVAAVINDRLTVAIQKTVGIRHFVVAD